jgi:hypothetical protein
MLMNRDPTALNAVLLGLKRVRVVFGSVELRLVATVSAPLAAVRPSGPSESEKRVGW